MAIGDSDTVLALSVGQLAAALRQGKIKAVEVLYMYKERALSIHAACNCVVHWCPDAEEEARKADEHLQRTGQVLGPLHGVPCSIKDHYNVRGSPIGANMITLKKRWAKPAKWDDPFVVALRRLGAIPFAKTTMSQMGETVGGGGPADGDTLNPWDTLRTTFGSSCGEGALVGGCAAPFGMGSDIGGSVRLPSAACGLCTLKPTTGRLTSNPRAPGENSMVGTAGVMARTAEDVAMVYSDLFSEKLFDAEPGIFPVPPIPFNHAVFGSKRPLRIGYYVDECIWPVPCPTARRAVDEVVEGLKRRGHEVVPFRPATNEGLDVGDFIACDISFFETEKPTMVNKGVQEDMSGTQHPDSSFLPAWADDPDEQVHPDFKSMKQHAEHPVYEQVTVKHVTHAVYEREGSSTGYVTLMARRDRFRYLFFRAWRTAGLDLLICPTVPFPATRVEDTRYLQKMLLSARLFNFLDMPAGHVTTTQVTAQDLALGYDPQCLDPDMNQAARRTLQDAEGLPMGVQVSALPWQEELCLRGMCEVSQAQPFAGVHFKVAPVPRRSPTLGARPELVGNQGPPQARL